MWTLNTFCLILALSVLLLNPIMSWCDYYSCCQLLLLPQATAKHMCVVFEDISTSNWQVVLVLKHVIPRTAKACVKLSISICRCSVEWYKAVLHFVRNMKCCNFFLFKICGMMLVVAGLCMQVMVIDWQPINQNINAITRLQTPFYSGLNG